MTVSAIKNPDPLNWLTAKASKNSKINEIILFGSRARNSHQERSDYDIAVKGNFTNAEWALWANEVREKFPSLCGIDLILISNDIATDLLKKIQQEGRVIYTKSV